MSRIGWAALAALIGLISGSATFAVLATVRVLISPDLHFPSAIAFVRGAFGVLAAGLFWSLFGGAILAFPLAVVVFSFNPPKSQAAALAISALLFVPYLIVGLNSAFDTILVFVSIWVGTQVGLSVLSSRIQ